MGRKAKDSNCLLEIWGVEIKVVTWGGERRGGEKRGGEEEWREEGKGRAGEGRGGKEREGEGRNTRGGAAIAKNRHTKKSIIQYKQFMRSVIDASQSKYKTVINPDRYGGVSTTI